MSLKQAIINLGASFRKHSFVSEKQTNNSSESVTVFAALDRQRLRHLHDLGLKTRCFFDIGASTGGWSRKVGEDFPGARFEMFEPLADHIPKYQEKMSRLLEQGSRFRLHKYAVGAETRLVEMHILAGDPFGSTALEMKHTPKDAKRIEVDMITIDEAISAWNLPVPNVIKMDTQGSELAILQGAQQTLPHVDVLFCETWLTRAYGPATPLLIELSDWLRDLGFYLWDFGDVYRDEKGILISPDCIFLNARNKISLLGDELNRR